MYIARPDATWGPDEWRPFVVAQGFGHLAAAGRDRDVPVVVPTQYVLDGDTLLLHLAVGNPIWTALDERPRALLSVAGDWAFIPSAWKAIGDEDPALGIPTTYYGAVQLTGDIEILDADDLLPVLRSQLAAYEPELAHADPEVHRSSLPAIRGLRLTVTDVRAKFKYGNNVDVEHREAVVGDLLARGGPGDAAAAAQTLRRIAGPQPAPATPVALK